MPPKKKFRSGRAKKRKFTGNKYTRQKNLMVKETLVELESIEKSDESDLDRLDETDTQTTKTLQNDMAVLSPKKQHMNSNKTPNKNAYLSFPLP